MNARTYARMSISCVMGGRRNGILLHLTDARFKELVSAILSVWGRALSVASQIGD
jgi:hypothetical protein